MAGQQNPYDQFDAAPSAAPTSPTVIGTPRPAKPAAPNLPQGWQIGADGNAYPVPGLPTEFTDPKVSGGKTTYRTLTTKETTERGLPPGVWQLGSDGKTDKIADVPKIEPDLQSAIKGLGIDELLTNIGRARTQMKTGFATGVLGSIAGHFPGSPRNDFLGSLEGIKGAAILEKLQALRDQSKNGASGMGSLTEQEGERLANSITSLNPDMSAAELKSSFDIMERHAKALQAVAAGKDPSDPAVQHEYGIMALPGADGKTPPPPAAGGDIPPQNPLANGGGGDQGPTLTPSAGGTRSVIDPQKQALGAKITALMSKGADRNTILGYAVRADPTLRTDPQFRAWVDQGISYRKKYPGAKFPIDPGFYTNEVPLSQDEQDRNAGAQSDLGALAMNAGNAATAGLVGKVTGDGDRINQALAVSQAQHPESSLAGMIGGGALAGMGGEAALGKLGMEAGVMRGALSDAAYGGVSGAASNQDMNAPGRIVNGALAGLGGSLVGQGLARVPGAALRGATNPVAGYVAKQEIPLTLGQAVGGKLKGFEDSLSGIRVVGDQINARRMEGLQKMNSKAFDKALEPIKGTVSGQFGEQAVADAQDKIGQAFRTALGGKVATLDRGFIVDATKAKMGLEKLPDRVRGELNSSIDEVINNYFDDSGKISGENLQTALEELRNIKGGYYDSKDPLKNRIGKVVDAFSDSVENMFRRQAPDVMPQYDAAKASYRRLNILADAVNRAKNETDGKTSVFTTGQLGMSDRANSIKFDGKIGAAAGASPFHEFHQKMQAVLPNKVPDSGTAGRLLVPLALMGAGGAGGELSGETKTGLTLGTLLALAYTKTGQRALTARVLSRSNAAKTAGRALARIAPASGHVAASSSVLGSSRD